MQVFGELHSTPVCELFSPANATGFTGPCRQLPSSCQDNITWCGADDGSNPGPNIAEQLMALNLAGEGFLGIK